MDGRIAMTMLAALVVQSFSIGEGLGPGPHGNYEPASYYAAELGLSEPSPYCLSRGGYAQFESWNTDTSATGLTYQLPYLDARRTYKLRVVLYHEGDSTWSANLRCDSGSWHRVRAEPRVPDTFWLQVPKALYKDARIVVDVARVSGDHVSLAGLKLYQLEPEPDWNEGVQGTSGPGVLCTRLLNCAPNPLGRATTISYELACGEQVTLTIRDVMGRVVRRLAAGLEAAGSHSIAWDGMNDKGRILPAGIYFCRLQAGGVTETKRVTLIR